MSLSAFEPTKKSVTINDSISIEVRGLSLNDISRLIQLHAQDLDGVFDLYSQGVGAGKELDSLVFANYLLTLISSAPGLISSIIAVSADEPTMADKASLLPITAQYDLMMAVFELTFSDIATLKKIMANVMEKVGEANGKTVPAKRAKKKG